MLDIMFNIVQFQDQAKKLEERERKCRDRQIDRQKDRQIEREREGQETIYYKVRATRNYTI